MGFLKRINGVICKRSEVKTIDLNDYCSAKIKELLSKNASNYSIYEDNLALRQPVKFINRYLNYDTIKNAIEVNPNITRILKENNLSLNFELKNVSSIVMSHLVPTCKTAQKIYSKMGYSEKDSSYIHLSQAALLHDIGKVFIPTKILNKKGKLTRAERNIIELHNILSYEILKTTNLHPIVSQLALEHHNYSKAVVRNKENQTLTVSDIYCALREKRSYKNPMSDIRAKIILYDMGTKGEFDTRYISYLNA